jgi:hypothetical protein
VRRHHSRWACFTAAGRTVQIIKWTQHITSHGIQDPVRWDFISVGVTLCLLYSQLLRHERAAVSLVVSLQGLAVKTNGGAS